MLGVYIKCYECQMFVFNVFVRINKQEADDLRS